MRVFVHGKRGALRVIRAPGLRMLNRTDGKAATSAAFIGATPSDSITMPVERGTVKDFRSPFGKHEVVIAREILSEDDIAEIRRLELEILAAAEEVTRRQRALRDFLDAAVPRLAKVRVKAT